MDDLHRISAEEFKQSEKFPIIIVLDNIRSMHNVGSVFRSADAFRIEKVALCGYTPRPPHRDINKTALGATDTVNWEYHTSTLDAVQSLKKQGFQVFGIEQVDTSLSLEKWHEIYHPSAKTAIVLGNEVEGVDEEVLKICDGHVEIPQFGSKHSLNISVAAGIVLWELTRIRLLPNQI